MTGFQCDLTESGVLPGYKVAGVYLRFKKEQVEQYKKKQSLLEPKPAKGETEGLSSRVGDFFYFNDFYILAIIFVVLLGYLVYRGL